MVGCKERVKKTKGKKKKTHFFLKRDLYFFNRSTKITKFINIK